MLCFSELDRKVQELDEPEMTEESILDFINKITNLYSEVMVDCFGECITEDVGWILMKRTTKRQNPKMKILS